MAATVTMVPVAKIKPRAGFNPRSEFADEQMAELVESVRRHGIITPLTLAPDGDGFVIVDHKTFGSPVVAAIREHAQQYLPQLAAYGAAIDGLGRKRVLEWWLHFVLGGVCLRCEGVE